MTGRSLLLKLLQRGDEIGIEAGKVVVRAKSGKDVPKNWMKEHQHGLAKAILCELKVDAFEYVSFSTGFYGKNRHGGVTMQFESVVTGEEAYAIFNAELTRARNRVGGKRGSPLPNKRFRVGRRHQFYKFWKSTGLPMPASPSSFHDYMGKLKGIFFTVDVNGKRMDSGSIKPLSLPAQTVRELLLPDNLQTKSGQTPDITQITMPDKDFLQTRASTGLQPNQSTGVQNHGNKVISRREDTGVVVPFYKCRKPEEQTDDEWLAEYDATDFCHRPGERE